MVIEEGTGGGRIPGVGPLFRRTPTVVHNPCDLPGEFPMKLESVVNNTATEYLLR